MSNNVSDRNVFILGAGFSRDAGAPLIHDFLDRARGFYDDPEGGLDTHERAQFAEVFRFKREVAKAREKFRIDLDNIEELFGLVEMSQRLGSTSAETRDAMVYLIAKTLQLAISNPAQRSQVRVGLNRGYAWDFINTCVVIPPAQIFLRRISTPTLRCSSQANTMTVGRCQLDRPR